MKLVIDMSTREVDFEPEPCEAPYTEEVLESGWNPTLERLEPVATERSVHQRTLEPPPAVLQGDIGLFLDDDVEA